MPRLTSLSPQSPLASVLDDIERSIAAQLYYPGLLVTLTVPEICSALLLDKIAFVNKGHYIAFVNKYTTEPALGIDG